MVTIVFRGIELIYVKSPNKISEMTTDCLRATRQPLHGLSYGLLSQIRAQLTLGVPG